MSSNHQSVASGVTIDTSSNYQSVSSGAITLTLLPNMIDYPIDHLYSTDSIVCGNLYIPFFLE